MWNKKQTKQSNITKQNEEKKISFLSEKIGVG
jgi:hypothetical protein